MDLTIRIVDKERQPDVKLTVEDDCTVGNLRQKIKEACNKVEGYNCTVIFSGTMMKEDEFKLTKYGIKTKNMLSAMFKPIPKVVEQVKIVQQTPINNWPQANVEVNQPSLIVPNDIMNEIAALQLEEQKDMLVSLLEELPTEALQRFPGYDGNSIENSVEAMTPERVTFGCFMLLTISTTRDMIQSQVDQLNGQDNHQNNNRVVTISLNEQEMNDIRTLELMGFGPRPRLVMIYAQNGRDVNTVIDYLTAGGDGEEYNVEF